MTKNDVKFSILKNFARNGWHVLIGADFLPARLIYPTISILSLEFLTAIFNVNSSPSFTI